MNSAEDEQIGTSKLVWIVGEPAAKPVMVSPPEVMRPKRATQWYPCADWTLRDCLFWVRYRDESEVYLIDRATFSLRAEARYREGHASAQAWWDAAHSVLDALREGRIKARRIKEDGSSVLLEAVYWSKLFPYSLDDGSNEIVVDRTHVLALWKADAPGGEVPDEQATVANGNAAMGAETNEQTMPAVPTTDAMNALIRPIISARRGANHAVAVVREKFPAITRERIRELHAKAWEAAYDKPPSRGANSRSLTPKRS